MQAPKNFFLISFIPAIAYWYLEENYTIEVALVGGLILSVLEVTLEKVIYQHVHTISKFNFFLIATLGGIALIAKDGLLFKLQPFFTGTLMSLFLFWRLKSGRGLIAEMSSQMNNNQQRIPLKTLNYLERNMALFLLVYGLFMGGVALKMETKQWLFFKTIGFYLASFIFIIGQAALIRYKKINL